MKYQIIPKEVKLGICKAVHDGDSIKVQFEDGETCWVRLYGCDAPEVISNHVGATQTFGKEAGDILRNLVKGQKVEVHTLFLDQYKRMICNVFLIKEELGQDIQKIDLTKEMIARGCAWWLNESKLDKNLLSELKTLHEYAKGKLFGLWGVEGRKVRPSTFRSKNRRFSLSKEFEDLW